MNMNRSASRAALLDARRAISPVQRKQWDKEIADQVLAWCQANPVSTIGVYSPIQAEPSLAEIFPALVALGLRLALPRAPAQHQQLIFCAWAPGDALMKDRYGVLVPVQTAVTVKPDALIIPCVGYTRDGYRLGYGGGFYDRTLESRPRPKTVGIAYRFSLCTIEIEPHDIPMDSVITNF